MLQARGKVSEVIGNAIVHYRDDLDLQNLIDFGQKEVSFQKFRYINLYIRLQLLFRNTVYISIDCIRNYYDLRHWKNKDISV